MASWLLVVNPKSGRGSAPVRAEALAAGLEASGRVEVAMSAGRGDATRLAAGAAGEADRVVAVGGDGTLNEVLAGLLSVDEPPERIPALGFFPTGTANVAGRAFGFPADADACAGLLRSAPGRPVDVGWAGGRDGERPFLLWLGAGYDAVVIDALNRERTGRMGISGLVRRAPGVWRALSRYPSPAIAQIGDGVDPIDDVAGVIVANIGAVAFGGSVTPAADPADGVLELVRIPRAQRLELISLGARMIASHLDRHPRVRCDPVERVRLDADEPVPYHLDGEPVGTLPVDVRVGRGAIRLLAP